MLRPLTGGAAGGSVPAPEPASVPPPVPLPLPLPPPEPVPVEVDDGSPDASAGGVSEAGSGSVSGWQPAASASPAVHSSAPISGAGVRVTPHGSVGERESS